MPRPVRPLSQWSIIADLRRDVDRLRLRSPSQQVIFTHDTFTAAGTPSTTYQLTYLPTDGSVLLAKQGLVLREGTDYTVDGTTGIVTVTASQTAGDQIVFRYATTGELIANNATVETDNIVDTFNRADSTTTPNPASDGSTWTDTVDSLSGWKWGISTNRLYLPTTTTGWTNGGSAGTGFGPGAFTQNPIIRQDLFSVSQDVTVDVTMPNDAPHTLIFLNFDPTTRGAYFLHIGGSTNSGVLYRASDNSGGTRSTLGTFSFTSWPFPAGTQTIRVTHNGTGTLKVYQAGTLMGTYTDGSPLTGTQVGLSVSVSGVFFDNFTATP